MGFEVILDLSREQTGSLCNLALRFPALVLSNAADKWTNETRVFDAVVVLDGFRFVNDINGCR